MHLKVLVQNFLGEKSGVDQEELMGETHGICEWLTMLDISIGVVVVYFTSEPRCLDEFLNTYFMCSLKADIFVSKPFS